MISTDNPDEKTVALKHIGTFEAPDGTFKILTVILKVNRPQAQPIREVRY
jgi:hypothetical protein